jgi:hypothetical protein
VLKKKKGACSMKKIDLKKDLKHLYRATPTAVIVEVPPMRFLAVDGQGDPNTSEEYIQAVQALFSVSYAAKFLTKNGPQKMDYAVMPLEGLWWADDFSVFTKNDKRHWKWTMMIVQPPFVAEGLLAHAISQMKHKKPLPGLERLRVDSFAEGPCAQVLHVGPYAAEGPTIERLHEFIAARGSLTGKHHEIYLGDVRRAAPEKLKTILRQPLKLLEPVAPFHGPAHRGATGFQRKDTKKLE